MNYRVRGGRNGKGLIEIWANGRLIARVIGSIGDKVAAGSYQYFKFGIYRNFAPGSATAYLDNYTRIRAMPTRYVQREKRRSGALTADRELIAGGFPEGDQFSQRQAGYVSPKNVRSPPNCGSFPADRTTAIFCHQEMLDYSAATTDGSVFSKSPRSGFTKGFEFPVSPLQFPFQPHALKVVGRTPQFLFSSRHLALHLQHFRLHQD